MGNVQKGKLKTYRALKGSLIWFSVWCCSGSKGVVDVISFVTVFCGPSLLVNRFLPGFFFSGLSSCHFFTKQMNTSVLYSNWTLTPPVGMC